MKETITYKNCVSVGIKMLSIFFIISLMTTVSLQAYADSKVVVNSTRGHKNDVKIKTHQDSLDSGDECVKGSCVRKCCPFGQVFYLSKHVRDCVQSDSPFDPPVFHQRQKEPVCGIKVTEKYHVVVGKMNCSKELREKRVLNRAKIYLLTVRIVYVKMLFLSFLVFRTNLLIKISLLLIRNQSIVYYDTMMKEN